MKLFNEYSELVSSVKLLDVLFFFDEEMLEYSSSGPNSLSRISLRWTYRFF